MKDYLTEQNLKLFLEQRFSELFIHNKQLVISDFKFRPDFYFPELKLVIEFNGFYHYTTPTTILKDYTKKRLLLQGGFTFIEIPYFVQLDQTVVGLLFADYISDLTRFNTYPHGFIDVKAPLPAQFCSLGVARFREEIDNKFSVIKFEILRSLEIHSANQKNSQWVYPVGFINEN